MLCNKCGGLAPHLITSDALDMDLVNAVCQCSDIVSDKLCLDDRPVFQCFMETLEDESIKELLKAIKVSRSDWDERGKDLFTELYDRLTDDEKRQSG